MEMRIPFRADGLAWELVFDPMRMGFFRMELGGIVRNAKILESPVKIAFVKDRQEIRRYLNAVDRFRMLLCIFVNEPPFFLNVNGPDHLTL